MAEPFNSQQSLLMINVSENHSSTDSSPQANTNEQTLVERSPEIEETQTQFRMPDTVERVEDSYQESPLSKAPNQQHAPADDEDDLYAVSPEGKAKLDAAVSAKKSTQAKQGDQPAPLPARNPIDALLDEGAVAATSARKVSTSKRALSNGHRIADRDRDYIGLDAGLKAADVTAKGQTQLPTNSNKRKSGDTDLGHRPGRGDEDSGKEKPGKDNLKRLKSSGSARPAEKAPAATGHGPVRSTAADDTKLSGGTEGNTPPEAESEARSKTIKKKDTSKAQSKSAVARSQVQDGLISRKQSSQSTKASKSGAGRPLRQAKQSALGKLKAKQGKMDSEDEEDSDDEEEDSDDLPSDFVMPKKTAKRSSDRTLASKHLPTPVTNGNTAKQSHTQISQGKLKSVKSKNTIASQSTAKSKLPMATAAHRNVPASGASKERKKDDMIGREKEAVVIEPANEATPVINKKEAGSKAVPVSQRPGALKRPARSNSRGRKPRRETVYEFPDATPPKTKKNRSKSRASMASRASTAKAGPTRLSMQSELAKDRKFDPTNKSKVPMISEQPSPRVKKASQKSSTAKQVQNIVRQTTDSPAGFNAQRHSQELGSPWAPTKDEAVAKGHAPAVKTKAPVARKKAGSSQANAIMIEQDSQSSSSPSSSPPKQSRVVPKPKELTKNEPVHSRPQTPAMMPSSPPGSGKTTTYTLVKDKPTIISFGKHGPRNQGTASAKKHPEAAHSSKAPSVYGTAEPGSSDRLSRFSVDQQPQAKHVPRKSNLFVTEPGNVSTGNEDVFSAFDKKTKRKPPASKVEHQHSFRQTAREGENDGAYQQQYNMAATDEFDGTTLMEDEPHPSIEARQPTASQMAMPPPNARATVKVQAKLLAAGELSRPKPVTQNKALTVANRSGSAVARKTANEPLETISTRDVPSTESTKRLLAGPVKPSKPAVKKSILQPTQAKRSREPKEQDSDTERVPKKTKLSKEKKLNEFDLVETSSREFSGLNVPPALSARPDNPIKRIDRRRGRPTRRTTQGSQGVDILGSPYNPAHLEVPRQATALEVLSQQSGLSSDKVLNPEAPVAGRLNIMAIPSILPPMDSEVMSSNEKQVPAGPHESSKAVTRIASGPLAEQMLAPSHANNEESDPFTSSRERAYQSGYAEAVSEFEEALLRRGTVLSRDRHARAQSGNRERAIENDPDKTLVEPLSDQSNAVAHEMTIGSPGANMQPKASTHDATALELEDVGDWRNSLKPHETHLFDALVVASHRLVKEIIHEDMAKEDVIKDYRRRGEIIVEELQRAHAKEFQQYVQNTQAWKKRAADELAAHGRALKQSMRDAEKARAERRKARREQREAMAVLEDLVAGLD